MKRCAICGETKPLDDFHRQKGGAQGRHSYCKACYLPRYKGRDRAKPEAAVRRAQNIKSRYGLSLEDVERMRQEQGGRCAICQKYLDRFHIDHEHSSGAVRGLLCHRCNTVIGGLDDKDFLRRVLAYLGWN